MDNSVSIIVPCYNSELTIEKCALSILKNIENTDNPNNFELIIVNDGSNDATKDIIKNINNAKIINHNKNQGLSAARNSGIKKSNSEYIIFIDSDIILSDKNISEATNRLNPLKNKVNTKKIIKPYESLCVNNNNVD